VTPMKNVKWKYNEIKDASAVHGSWLRDASTLSSGQNRGIGVCNKSDGTPAACAPFPAVPGGYRQCPSSPAVACASQFAFPNHSWMPLCSSGKPELTALSLWAGTDLAEAIRVGAAKLVAAHQTGEPMVLVIITDGSPMACTGPGGGGLCGTGWQPCCANGLTCGASYVASNGNTYGGGAFGDGSPNAGVSGTITAPATATGGTACTEAHKMVNDAIAEADNAAAQNIDLFVIGFFSVGSRGEAFANTLHRNRGTTFTTDDTTTVTNALKAIPSNIPLSIVR